MPWCILIPSGVCCLDSRPCRMAVFCSALLASPYLVRLVPVLLCTCWSCHARSCCRVCVGLDTGRPCASRGCHGRLRGSCASCSRHCCLPLGTVVWTRPSPVTALHPQHLGVLCTSWSMQRLQPQLPFVRPSRCGLRSVAVNSVSASGISAQCAQRCRIEGSSVRNALHRLSSSLPTGRARWC